MKKLVSLRSYLEPLYSYKFNSWVEDMTLKGRGSVEGNKVLLHTLEYRAVISMESFAYQEASIELFSARLLTWLADNDDRSELNDKDPDISCTLLDDEVAEIEVTLQFEEDVYICESESGPIEFKGKKWAFVDIEHDFAETFEITTAASYG